MITRRSEDGALKYAFLAFLLSEETSADMLVLCRATNLFHALDYARSACALGRMPRLPRIAAPETLIPNVSEPPSFCHIPRDCLAIADSSGAV